VRKKLLRGARHRAATLGRGGSPFGPALVKLLESDGHWEFMGSQLTGFLAFRTRGTSPATTIGIAAALILAGCTSPAPTQAVVPAESTQPTSTSGGPSTQLTTTTAPVVTATVTAATLTTTTLTTTTLATTTTTTTTLATTTTTTRPVAALPALGDLESIRFQVDTVAEFDFPTSAAVGPDGALYVAGQLGPVWRLDNGTIDEELVLDLTSRTSVIQAASSERGVLGIAFSPVDDRLYVHFTDTEGGTVVASWALQQGVADIESERLVLTQSQPGPGHNGGGIVFAPGGELFVGIGDGGASNGDDARDLTNFLGTVLRVLPRENASGYIVPNDNPFVRDEDVAPEIWAFGFRNPWRLFYDAPTENLWIADVGNKTSEELNVIAPEAPIRDFGWNIFEGTRRLRNRDIGDTILPTHEWGREVGVASIGAVVYRQDEIPELDGAVVFGDLSGTIMLLGADGVSIKRPGVAGLVSLHIGPRGELYGLIIWGELVELSVAP